MTDFIQISNIDSSKSSKLKWVIIIGFVLILGILVINFSSLKSLLLNNPLNSLKTNISIEDKAKEAGYKIIWQGDSKDGTGRDVLLEPTAQIDNYWKENIGLSSARAGSINLVQDKYIGVFNGFQVDNSKNLYVVLLNPVNQRIFRGKILIDNSAKEDPDIKTVKNTAINVVDLNIGPAKSKAKNIKRVALFKDLDKILLNKYLRVGDIIEVLTIPRDNSKEAITPGDQSISQINLRRFGGTTQLKIELDQLRKEVNKK